MTEPNVPPRWLDQPQALSAPLAAALDAYQDRAPSGAERDAMLAALDGRLSAARTGTARARWLQRIGLSAALGGMIVAFAVLKPTPAARDPHAERTAPAARTASMPEIVAAAPEPALGPPPAAAATETPASVPAAGRPRARAIASDPSAELALLTAARRVLGSAPARSLELSAEHARRFPRGAFAEERDLLRIEALLRSGKRAAATRQARRFRSAYPQSAHLERLAELFTP